jgi:hypothetical protein
LFSDLIVKAGHLFYIRPGRDRDAPKIREVLDDVPSRIQRLTASVTVEPESLENRKLVREDELGKHIRDDSDGFLAFAKAPHILQTDLFGIEAGFGQLRGESKSTRADIAVIVVCGASPIYEPPWSSPILPSCMPQSLSVKERKRSRSATESLMEDSSTGLVVMAAAV